MSPEEALVKHQRFPGSVRENHLTVPLRMDEIMACNSGPFSFLRRRKTNPADLPAVRLPFKTGGVMKRIACILAAVALLAGSLSGCASIVSKSNWPVTVQSNPTGAKCAIFKENGVQVHTGETPMTVTLDASDGFFSSAKYTVKCSKDGHPESSSELSAHLNGWYIGNIVFGGLIGILIVDPATGAMWKLDETHVVNMASNDAPFKSVSTPNVTKAGTQESLPVEN